MLSRGKIFVKLLSAIIYKMNKIPNELVAIGESVGKQNVLPAVGCITQGIIRADELRKELTIL